jgi:hypothetical protein
MRISRATLSEPKGSDRVPEGTLGYFRSRNKHRVYSLVIGEFKRCGLTQADLARRLGKGTDIVCRWLGSPGNWTQDTVSDLLFAISGAEPDYAIRYPLRTAEAETQSLKVTAFPPRPTGGTVRGADPSTPPKSESESNRRAKAA